MINENFIYYVDTVKPMLYLLIGWLYILLCMKFFSDMTKRRREEEMNVRRFEIAIWSFNVLFSAFCMLVLFWFRLYNVAIIECMMLCISVIVVFLSRLYWQNEDNAIALLFALGDLKKGCRK